MPNDFTPTDEQLAVLDAGKNSSDNLLIQALAGAAKTTTLVMLANELRSVPALSLAFNKKIQLEMEARLPGNVTAKTLNGLGHGVWSSAIGKRLTLDKDKVYKIVKSLVDELKGEDKSAMYEVFSDMTRAVSQGKTAGFVPGNFSMAKPLMDEDEFFNWLTDEPSELMWEIIQKASRISAEQALVGLCDFDDQILMPTCFWGAFTVYPLVFIDEAQDLSALNHAMLRKFARKRVIAVGDEHQSIYGFRGAHADSMALLHKTFNMTRLSLSTTFRCPQAVVKEARWRTPFMKWASWAKEGEVRRLTKWNETSFSDDSVVLCRNNAPLFSLAMLLLRHGRYPELVGNDIGKGLIKEMKKWGDLDMSVTEAQNELDAWTQKKLAKSRDPSIVHDKAACMQVFLDSGGETLGDCIAYAQHLLNSSGRIKLMTIHKAKGLEFDEVFILERDLIRTDRHVQEKNLLYVAQTRAKERLTYIDLAGWREHTDISHGETSPQSLNNPIDTPAESV